MKKTLISLLLSGLSLGTFAQSSSFGVKGSVNFATLTNTYSYTTVNASTGSITTFAIGGFADFKLGNWSVQPGAYFTGRGDKEAQSISGYDLIGEYSIKRNIYYAQVPVHVLYHVPVVIGDIFFGAGPYLSVGVGGKIQGSSKYINEGNPNGQAQTTYINHNIKFGNNDGDDLKPFDHGASFLVGVHLKSGVLFSANYDLGIPDIAPAGQEIKLHNRALQLSVGLTF